MTQRLLIEYYFDRCQFPPMTCGN